MPAFAQCYRKSNGTTRIIRDRAIEAYRQICTVRANDDDKLLLSWTIPRCVPVSAQEIFITDVIFKRNGTSSFVVCQQHPPIAMHGMVVLHVLLRPETEGGCTEMGNAARCLRRLVVYVWVGRACGVHS